MMFRSLGKFTLTGMAAAAAVSGLIGIGTGTASAQTVWKMHIVWVPARPEAGDYKRFTDIVNEKAKGKLQIEFHPGGAAT
jgi:TRAP-type transport system periplasmic protein